MAERILVFKNKHGRKEYRVTTKMRRMGSPRSCSMVVNLENYKDVALFLHDLEDLWNCPMEKAARFYLSEKNNGWPF
jgi:hypothetical protein